MILIDILAIIVALVSGYLLFVTNEFMYLAVFVITILYLFVRGMSHLGFYIGDFLD